MGNYYTTLQYWDLIEVYMGNYYTTLQYWELIEVYRVINF